MHGYWDCECRMTFDFELQFASASDGGRVRPQNQDYVAFDDAIGLALLADGMGGHKGGEVASYIAVTRVLEGTRGCLTDFAERKVDVPVRYYGHLLADQVIRANAVICTAGRDHVQYEGMGTTLVGALFRRQSVFLVNIGDSRIYRLRDGDLTRVTTDHSVVQAEIESGIMSEEEARRSAHRHLVTRALGVSDTESPDMDIVDAAPDDIYLLCSDGLSDMLSDEEIAIGLLDDAANLQARADRLIDRANRAGGRDNVSVVLAKVGPPVRKALCA
ncbi:MAG: stage sporulation family protein [Betaproteobacteria bacterium]|nr:stage sporulation family protein [Betaproteobacteria bacterium]